MKRIIFILALLCLEKSLHAQYIYTIKADSVKITNSCDTAELIIENHTQTVPGFLFNKGKGRTEFRKALTKVDDSIYVVGGDTIKLSVAWLQGGNKFGTTGLFGTLDNNHIDFITNNTKRGRWANTGNLLIGGETDYGYKMAVNGAVYSQYFTNSTTPLDAGDGALRLRWGGPGGSYMDFYYQGNTNRRGFISSGADGRPLSLYDQIGLSLSTTPFLSIGTEWPTSQGTKFSLTTGFNSTQDPMRVANLITEDGLTSTSYLRVKASGNTLLGEGEDNGNKLQVNGTGWFGNNVYISHPTYTTGIGAGMGWTGDNLFQIYGGPAHESLTFGPYNVITSNVLVTAPSFYGTSTAEANYYVPANGGVYSTANSPGNVDGTIYHKLTIAPPGAGTGNGNVTLVEINKPVNRGTEDGLETGLRIKFTVNGTANKLRALETVNGDVRLHTTSGRTSIGLDGSSTITSRLDISGEDGYNQLRLRKKYTPTSSSDANGAEGDVSWDDNYIYIKTSSGWKRSTLSSF
jgi:hypothetical protein